MVRKNKKDRTIHKYFGLLMILILGCIVGYSMKQCKTCEVCEVDKLTISDEYIHEKGIYDAVSSIFSIVNRNGYVMLNLDNETLYLAPISNNPIENSLNNSGGK